MVILDTNTVSELMRPMPGSVVSIWFSSQDRNELRVTAVTKAELLFGAMKLPFGRRRNEVLGSIERVLRLFPGSILAFDDEAASKYAEIMAHRRAIGRSMEGHELDCEIAAIARANGAAVATRNVRDFADCGVSVINPWNAVD